MYISRVEIDSENRQKMKVLSNLSAVHSWVESSFPKEMAENLRTRKLWRIDLLNGRQYLLIVSPDAPDLDLLEKYGISGSAQTKPYDSFVREVKNGQQARFRITLNPVVAVVEKKGERGRVKPHVTAQQQKQYLLDRSEVNGFTVNEDEFDITQRTYLPFTKRGQQTINLSKVSYEGVLTVTNVEAFQKTLVEGFGKKKAYGFGLMTIIPTD